MANISLLIGILGIFLSLLFYFPWMIQLFEPGLYSEKSKNSNLRLIGKYLMVVSTLLLIVGVFLKFTN